ncbi:ketimine reductase mu-crystallin-like [Amphiura filiformis]|uniref:ketimine reductase mu-crystallin-like n=1 Tax=Amphiura filiformis TaxID=82378 RepID=UPI003B214E85
MDSGHLNAMRTAAATAAATKLLAPDNSSILAIIGAGKQGIAHVQALRHVGQFKQVRVWSRNYQNAKDFANVHDCVPCETVEEAVMNADVIVTATHSKTPILAARWVKKGALVNCVGAVVEDWQELDPDLMKMADVYVDTKEEALKGSGDIILSGVDIKGEVGELILGNKTVDRNATIVFKSMGMAVEDVACSKLIYDKSLTKPSL